MTDYSDWSEEQLAEKMLKERSCEVATGRSEAELKAFEEGGAWTAGYFVPGVSESAVDPGGVIGIMKVENAASRRDALAGLAHLVDLEVERGRRRKGG
jgi:hypothetical protein